MATNIGIGVINAIGFNRRILGGVIPPTIITDAMLFENEFLFLLEDSGYIALE